MAQSEWGERFLTSTRGQIISLLRRAPRTVNELAAALELTDNAIRAHLTALERDNLVRQAGSRPGFRKPNLTYELTADAGQFFPKPYGAILQQLLAVLGDRMSQADLESSLRDVGRRIASLYQDEVRAVAPRERVARAAAVLGKLGGLAEIEETDAGLMIRGFDCPLADVVADHPAGCLLAETLVSELTAAPVTERCERGSRPRCAFEVTLPKNGA